MTDRRWLLGDERDSIIAETNGAGAATIYMPMTPIEYRRMNGFMRESSRRSYPLRLMWVVAMMFYEPLRHLLYSNCYNSDDPGP